MFWGLIPNLQFHAARDVIDREVGGEIGGKNRKISINLLKYSPHILVTQNPHDEYPTIINLIIDGVTLVNAAPIPSPNMINGRV
jgi:hypothetical protein